MTQKDQSIEQACQTCKGQSQGGACGCHHCKSCDTYYSCYGFRANNYSKFLEMMKDVPIIDSQKTIWGDSVSTYDGILIKSGMNQNSDIFPETILCNVSGWNTGDGTFKHEDLWNNRVSMEVKTTNSITNWFDRMNKEELSDLFEAEDACGGVFACGGAYHDPTGGAEDEVEIILDDIRDRAFLPLLDQSLRDDEVKPAIMKNLKELLREAANQLESDGY